MKEFVESNGLFELEMPISWRYRLLRGEIHTFENVDDFKAPMFQISLVENNQKGIKTRLAELVKNAPVEQFGENLLYCLPDNKIDNIITKIWSSIISGYIVNFSLTYSSVDIDNVKFAEYLSETQEVIKSFRVIEPEHRQDKLILYILTSFIKGIAASMVILNNAVEHNAFIEATCILANQVDALLRIGIVLKSQLINRNNKIAKRWICQGVNDKKISEKDVYIEAKSLGIIDDELYNKLIALYEDRNRVIHRFIISEITFNEVEHITFHYYQISNEINSRIYKIEQEQIEAGVGMTAVDKNGNFKELLDRWVNDKLGKLSYFEDELK